MSERRRSEPARGASSQRLLVHGGRIADPLSPLASPHLPSDHTLIPISGHSPRRPMAEAGLTLIPLSESIVEVRASTPSATPSVECDVLETPIGAGNRRRVVTADVPFVGEKRKPVGAPSDVGTVHATQLATVAKPI